MFNNNILNSLFNKNKIENVIVKNKYLPEGSLINTDENRRFIKSVEALESCVNSGQIVEARCIRCDNSHNLIVDFGFIKGVIPRIEGAVGIDSEMTRDIALITRVNRPVCFIVTGFKNGMVLLSRKQAQLECITDYTDRFKIGDIIPAKITHIEQFRCYADIGCGLIAMILIGDASVSLILNMSDRFYAGQEITAAVKSIDSWGVDVSTITGTKNQVSIGTFTLPKITLTHKELLGTWEENAALFAEGETVIGIVRSIEKYGVFIELSPNLVGLADIGCSVEINQTVSVYIKAIIPQNMKIKLIIVDTFELSPVDYNYDYYIRSGRIDKWVYSTCTARKVIKSQFG